VQSPREIAIVFESNQEVQRVYLDGPIRKIRGRPGRRSWQAVLVGEQVGRYQGDTLVIDTIGLNDRTFVDTYRAPHTDELHVVERWRVVEGGNVMEVTFAVMIPSFL
jgi:hypothetical protein